MPNFNTPVTWTTRLRWSALTALAMFLTSLFCVWGTIGHTYQNVNGRWVSTLSSIRDYDLRKIQIVRDSIERYRQANGKLPEGLSELPEAKSKEWTTDETGEPLDSWRRHFIYQHDGNDY